MNNESMCDTCKHLHKIEYFDMVSDRCIYDKDINVYVIINCNKWQEKINEM